MTNSNKTFRMSEPAWANACVGNNGEPDYWAYSKGFSRAANLLIEQVLNDHIIYSTDTFIYPVCFNMRHSVELTLKWLIDKGLRELFELREKKFPEFNTNKSHDIGIIWGFFREHTEALDSRFLYINEEIDPIVCDIAEIDPTGQVFRYPYNTDNQKHLTEYSNIGFVTLQKQFQILEKGLDNLYDLTEFLLHEYPCKTFTNHLPRNKILELAKKLPQRNTWGEINFNECKKDIKESYGISNNELSKAIKIIENHYEFAPLIGLNIPLKGISEDDLVTLLDEWRPIGDCMPSMLEVSESRTYLSELSKIKLDIWSRVSHYLTPEILAGMYALYSFNSWDGFSEKYILEFEDKLRDTERSFSDSETVRKDFFRFFSGDLMRNIVKALYFLKKIDLVNDLHKRYGLPDKYEWLEMVKRGDNNVMVSPPKIGDIIRMRSWHGVVLDVFQNDAGKTILRVQTVRNIFRRLNPEFIEFDLAPDMIDIATMDDLQAEIENYQRVLNNSIDELMACSHSRSPI